MTFKSILLHVAAETSEPEAGPGGYALKLAETFRAELTALIYELDVVLPKSVYGRRITADAQAALAVRNSDVQERARLLSEAAARAGVKLELRTERSFAYTIPEIVAEQARLHDLTVSGVDDRGLLSEHAIAEYVLFQSGHPLVVVPASHSAALCLETIVVAWDYSRVAARAMTDALPLLRKGREIIIAAFGDDKEMESSLAREDVISSLRSRGVNARYQQAERGDRAISEAINTLCVEQGANLLVMGAYGHSRFREFILGGATRGVLEKPALPTFLSH